MAYDEALAAKVRAQLAGKKGYGEKIMFGGVCFLINGNMCCGVQKEDLMVRISKEDYPVFVKSKGARPMLFTGKEMPGFIHVGPAGTGSRPGLKTWVARCLAFSQTLPKKKAKKKGKLKK